MTALPLWLKIRKAIEIQISFNKGILGNKGLGGGTLKSMQSPFRKIYQSIIIAQVISHAI
ncbi:hypothetical protein DMZ48_03445 [Robertkochia solimangrovi]|nr:hypothetical protein DMZ48_03445 [Robertkochia solimangrovi]